MPTRLLRDGILESEAVCSLPRRQHIALAIRKRIWEMPCVVCGIPYDIKCDHIKPVRLGGDSSEGNIQSLCHACNHAKTYRLSNEQLRAVIAGRGLQHFVAAVYRQDTRLENPYGGTSQAQWASTKPSRVQHAIDLYLAFLGKHA